MASRSIAEELLSLVSPYNYRTVIPSLSWHDFITVKEFKKSNLGKLFYLQRDNCVINGKINVDHLFSLFGRYSDEDAQSVREDILERIDTGESVYTSVGKVFFKMHGINFAQWRERAKTGYGDELVLFTLCRVFHRHAVVICKNRNWSTLEPEGSMNVLELLDNCDIYLVYMRPGVFIELQHKENVTLQLTSPPEFPEWTTDPGTTGTVQVERMENLERFVDVTAFAEPMDINVRNEHTEGNNTSSPTSLRNSCIQCLMKHADRSTPHSLFLQAVNYISWVKGRLPPILFKCYAATSQKVELYFLRDSKPSSCADNKPCLVIGNYNDVKVTNSHQDNHGNMKVRNTFVPEKHINLYEDLYVNQSTHDLWIKRASTEKLLVVINKLTDTVISNWKPPKRETWKDIDPYSDLEEVPSSNEDNTIVDITEDNTVNSATTSPKYDLRKCVSTIGRHSTKPQRESRKPQSYADIITSSDSDTPKHYKRKVNKKPRPGSGPSLERIAAQGMSTIQPTSSHPIPSISNKKLEFDSIEPENLSDEDLIPLINFARSKHNESRNHKPAASPTPNLHTETTSDHVSDAPKGKLITIQHGIKRKYRKIRWFYCTMCEAKLNSQGNLNKHYRASHDPVKCPICPMTFTTPSTLARHKYIHSSERKYPCHRCSQSFVFPSELKVHKLSHRRLRTEACQHAGCNKAYFSKNELSKHVLTHGKTVWACHEPGCSYTMKDKRLLHSHKRLHSDEIRFTCETCGKGFKYHTQWTRHKAKPDKDVCIPLRRSDSPEL